MQTQKRYLLFGEPDIISRSFPVCMALTGQLIDASDWSFQNIPVQQDGLDVPHTAEYLKSTIRGALAFNSEFPAAPQPTETTVEALVSDGILIQPFPEYPVSTKHGKGNCHVARYVDGSLALLIVGYDGLVLAKATVCLVDAPLPDRKHVWLKGWSENDGIPLAMERAGIVRRTGETPSWATARPGLDAATAELAIRPDTFLGHLPEAIRKYAEDG